MDSDGCGYQVPLRCSSKHTQMDSSAFTSPVLTRATELNDGPDVASMEGLGLMPHGACGRTR